MFSTHDYRALRDRNYRLYFAGHLISMTGSWMQTVVQAWLVYRLTHSAHWLGLISAAHSLPAFFMSPLAGVLVDRMDRRKLLFRVEAVQMIQAFALAGLVFSGKIQPWQIAVLSGVLGITTAFEITTRHALTGEMMSREDLPSALSLNAVIINASRVVGPALGGALIGLIGEGLCFLLNGLSFLAVLYGLSVMRFETRATVLYPRGRLATQFAEAVAYVRRHPRILRLLALASIVSFLGFPYSVLLPVVAKEILHGGAGTLAWLTAMSGLGAVAGVLTIGWSGSGKSPGYSLERKILQEILLTGLALAALGFSRSFALSCASIFALGFFIMKIFPKTNNAIQQAVDPAVRGRVLSLYTMTFLGAVPLGSLLMGAATDRYGAGPVAIAAGTLCALTASAGLLGGKALAERFRCFSAFGEVKMAGKPN